MICHKILSFAFFNKRSSVYILKQEETPSLNNSFVISLKDSLIESLEHEIDENIDRILKNKEKFLQTNDFNIFSQNNITKTVIFKSK